jgi:hypothetical protein
MLRIKLKEKSYRLYCPVCREEYLFNVPENLSKHALLILPQRHCFGCKVMFPPVMGIIKWIDARVRYHRAKGV